MCDIARTEMMVVRRMNMMGRVSDVLETAVVCVCIVSSTYTGTTAWQVTDTD